MFEVVYWYLANKSAFDGIITIFMVLKQKV